MLSVAASRYAHRRGCMTMTVGAMKRSVWMRCTPSATLLYSFATVGEPSVYVTVSMPDVPRTPSTWPEDPEPEMTWRSVFVAWSAVRSRKMTSSKDTGDWSSSWIAMSC